MCLMTCLLSYRIPVTVNYEISEQSYDKRCVSPPRTAYKETLTVRAESYQSSTHTTLPNKLDFSAVRTRSVPLHSTCSALLHSTCILHNHCITSLCRTCQPLQNMQHRPVTKHSLADKFLLCHFATIWIIELQGS